MNTNEFRAYLQTYCTEKLEARQKRIESIISNSKQRQSLTRASIRKQLTTSPVKCSEQKDVKTFSESVNRVSTVNKQQRSKSAFKNTEDQSPAIVLRPPGGTPVINQSIARNAQNRSVCPSPINQRNSSISPILSAKPVRHTEGQEFFRTQAQSDAKQQPRTPLQYSKNTSRKVISTNYQSRHSSVPNAHQQTHLVKENADTDAVSPMKTLFNKNVFETNHQRSSMAQRIKINSRRPHDQKLKASNAFSSIEHNQQPSLALAEPPKHRAYFTSKTSQPKEEMEFQNTVIKAQEMLLTSKFNHPLDKEGKLIDISDEMSKYRKPLKKVDVSLKHVNLTDRVKKLPHFHVNQPPKEQEVDTPGAKNIHMQAKRMKAFVSDVFKSQIKIFNRIREDELNLKYKIAALTTNNKVNKTLNMIEYTNSDLESSFMMMNKSEVFQDLLMHTMTGASNYNKTSRSQLLGFEHSTRDASKSPGPGLAVRGLVGKGQQDSSPAF